MTNHAEMENVELRRADALIHRAIDQDQVMILELDILRESLDQGESKTSKEIRRIEKRAFKNSKLLTKARETLRKANGQ